MAATKPRAALYIRVSTLDQAREGYSLEAQEQSLRKYCSEKGYDVVELYADRGISGKDIDHRPDMQRLLSNAKSDCFDIVIFWALSRFTRSVADLYSIMQIMEQHKVALASYTEPFDTTTPIGRAMIGIVGVFAQLERELTGERVRAAMAVRASHGKRTCHEVLGYDLDGKDSLKINPREAEYVCFIYNTYLKSKSLSDVAALSRALGYRGKRGKEPTAYTVAVILSRPIYAGYNLFKGQLYKGLHQPIVSVEVFNKVQKLLKKQGSRTGRPMLYDLIQLPSTKKKPPDHS